MKFRYNVFDLEFIVFILINFIYAFWLPLALFIFTVIAVTIASIEYIEINNKPADIGYIIDYVVIFILALIPLLHICLKNFYLYFLVKRIIKNGKFKYRKLIKKVKDSLKIKRNVLLATLMIDLLVISFAMYWLNVNNLTEQAAFALFIILIYYIAGGFFLPYFILFKLLNKRNSLTQKVQG